MRYAICYVSTVAKEVNEEEIDTLLEIFLAFSLKRVNRLILLIFALKI